jgi:hypothetical protein
VLGPVATYTLTPYMSMPTRCMSQGYLGIPLGGFPEPFRSRVIRDRTLPDGRSCFTGRPGAEMKVW